MMISRRNFLAVGVSSVFLPKLIFANTTVSLRAEDVKLDLLPSKDQTALWGFNGLTPGPVIRVKKGERVNSRFTNNINQPSALHWHGIRIDNRMDGVPGLTQSSVKSGKSFNYDLRDTTLVDAGQSQKIVCVFNNPGKWLLHCHMLGHQASGMKTWVSVV